MRRVFYALVAVAAFAGSPAALAAPPFMWRQLPEPMPTASSADTASETAFAVPDGFRVERLFVVPKEQLGSWVALTVDPKGRIIASDHGFNGLARITPAPLDGSGETLVERIPAPVTAAQGLLWAFDSLYAIRNFGPESGLYRITDEDGDDLPETATRLHPLSDGGEHGPHAILLSPDGTRLFIVCGNHTQLPFTPTDLTPPQTMASIRTTQRRVALPEGATSRLPSNWDEDRIIARLWDAQGHAAGIVPQLVAALAASASGDATNLAPSEDDLRRMIGRNAHYGAAGREALERRADPLQVHYAYVLRTVGEPSAWTAADRRAYFEWFARARHWAGGSSFRKFLTMIETDALAHLTADERITLETLGVWKPYEPPPLPKPEGPGRAWTAAEVLAAAAKPGAEGLSKGRDFEHGRRAFAAARCVVCHRFGEGGGATGPDLTQAAGRFALEDLVEAIVDPGKVVSDQYKAHVVQTADGRVVTGRIVVDSPDGITLVVDPENAAKQLTIPRSDIEEMTVSRESLMPKGLLDGLNEQEVLDLLAYVLSRDMQYTPRFQ